MKGVPQGFHTVTPYLVFQDANRAIEFYRQAFGATEIFRWENDGKIGHAEIVIGDSPIMLADEHPAFAYMRSPQSFGGSPVHIFLYIEDVDALFHQAIAAGATEIDPPKDNPDGDRRGGVQDPFGYIWWMATQKENISREELQKRFAAQS